MASTQGEFMKQTGTDDLSKIQMATKFAPLPWRLSEWWRTRCWLREHGNRQNLPPVSHGRQLCFHSSSKALYITPPPQL